MATEAQIAANRRNAARSTGPKTAKGKARSAQNSTRHGLFSKTTVLSNENRVEYDQLVQSFVAKLEPRDPVEMRLVQRLADCEWRLTRTRYIETASIDTQIDDTAAEFAAKYAPGTDDAVRIVFAMRESPEKALNVCTGAQAQENRLQRQYLNIWQTFLTMRQATTSLAGLTASLGKKSTENEPNSASHGRGYRQDLYAA